MLNKNISTKFQTENEYNKKKNGEHWSESL